jgi:hypothetical protein
MKGSLLSLDNISFTNVTAPRYYGVGIGAYAYAMVSKKKNVKSAIS